MRLLIVTQVVDTEDLYLGFFHRWLESFAGKFEFIEVICLKEGKHALPANVRVHSLGKERGAQPGVIYALRFLALIWKLRNQYDAAFVHMNQEYVILGWSSWLLMGKRIYMWRNHYAGTWLTDIAAFFCKKVFCTSKHSYTAKYKKTKLMPVGVDTDRFHAGTPKLRSILFFARIASSKRPEVFIDALALLEKQGVPYTASIYGSPLPKDELYFSSIRERAASIPNVTFYPGVPNDEAPAIFASHAIFVNCAQSGMFDKTLFEAAASGCLVVAASKDWQELAGDAYWFDGTAAHLALKLEELLDARSKISDSVVASNTLAMLSIQLAHEVY